MIPATTLPGPAADPWHGTAQAPATSLVDGHVHLYPCFAASGFFDRAVTNFAGAARQLDLAAAPLGWLLLTETAADDAFVRLRTAGGLDDGRWRFLPTTEACSLLAWRDDRLRLVLVAGRQIVSAGGIEVLALGTTARFPDGLPLATTVEMARRAGALVVLPWGFGKWLGRRGRQVARLVAAAQPGGIFLGDNAGRPAWSPRPGLFAAAERRGIAVLPGSDPLPLPQEAAKVGRYGFVAEVPFDPEAPFAALRRHLAGLAASPARFGRLERLPTFLHRQIAMQVRKRRGAR